MKEYVLTVSPPKEVSIVPVSIRVQQLLLDLGFKFKINYQDHTFAQFFVQADDMGFKKLKKKLDVHESSLRISEREFEEEYQ